MQLRSDVVGTGAASLQLKSFLPDGVVHIGDVVVPTSSFVLLAIAIVTALVLALVFRFTRFGLATRAASEHETGAILTGISPDRLGFLNWIIATVLAGLAVIVFAATSARLDPTETSLLVVPALAAALLGGLNSFAVTTAAALAISMLQSALGTFQTRADWLPDWLPNGGLRAALPVVLIVVAITVRGARLPTREALIDRRLPAAPEPRRPLVATLAISAVTIVGLLTLDEQWRLAIVVSTIATLIALSAVVVTGYVGQISLAQYAFAGLAAFTTAKLAIEGVAFPWAPLLAVIAHRRRRHPRRAAGAARARNDACGCDACRFRRDRRARVQLPVAQRPHRTSPGRVSSVSISGSSRRAPTTSAPRSGSSQSWSSRSVRSRSPTSVVARPACGGWPYAATNGLRRRWGST